MMFLKKILIFFITFIKNWIQFMDNTFLDKSNNFKYK